VQGIMFGIGHGGNVVWNMTAEVKH
jgi:hypothetical protein